MLAFVAWRTRESTHHLHSLRDPMMRLPVEIVAEIFILCLPDTYPGSSDQLPAKSRAPLLLLNICKHWADVAVSTPALWKNLVFHVRNYGVINEDGILEEVRVDNSFPGLTGTDTSSGTRTDSRMYCPGGCVARAAKAHSR
ncbi:hypothetical protein B0H19DRAFT_1141987 [Mycena capillaripes]|nr:hypothetical protein B0H19DRAFT_1141987 [Mycena capillaripes]